MQANEIVRAEMQTFVLALISYPERFAANPRVSFDQYLVSLMVPELILRPNSDDGKLIIVFCVSRQAVFWQNTGAGPR